VTADGDVLQVDDESHPDLFWAIRGGGGNFGVATKFTFRLHELPSIVGGMLILPATPQVLESFIAAADEAPDELSAIANIMVAPPVPFLPEEAHGKPIIMALVCYAGDADSGARAVAPFRALAEPVADLVRPMAYPEIYELGPSPPPPNHDAARSFFLEEVDASVAETIVDHVRAATAPMAVAQLRVLGGAVARVPAEATAFAHRDRRIMVALGAVWDKGEDSPVHESWVGEFARGLERGKPRGLRQLCR
jgi:FAD/FMN-containing dehydrogenase